MLALFLCMLSSCAEKVSSWQVYVGLKLLMSEKYLLNHISPLKITLALRVSHACSGPIVRPEE